MLTSKIQYYLKWVNVLSVWPTILILSTILRPFWIVNNCSNWWYNHNFLYFSFCACLQNILGASESWFNQFFLKVYFWIFFSDSRKKQKKKRLLKTCLSERNSFKRHRRSDMENSRATINGWRETFIIKQICFEKFQILCSIIQLLQMLILFITWQQSINACNFLKLKKQRILKKVHWVNKEKGFVLS